MIEPYDVKKPYRFVVIDVAGTKPDEFGINEFLKTLNPSETIKSMQVTSENHVCFLIENTSVVDPEWKKFLKGSTLLTDDKK